MKRQSYQESYDALTNNSLLLKRETESQSHWGKHKAENQLREKNWPEKKKQVWQRRLMICGGCAWQGVQALWRKTVVQHVFGFARTEKQSAQTETEISA